MIKKPYTFYDDLVDIGYHKWLIQGDNVPLFAVIVPPLAFFCGALAVFFIDLWSYLDDWDLYEAGLYYGDSEPTFNFSSLILPIIIATIAIVLFIFLFTIYSKCKQGKMEKTAIRYSSYRMHFVFGPRGEETMPIIPTYCVRHIHVHNRGYKDQYGNKVMDKYSVGTMTITYIDENNETKKFKIKNLAQAYIVGQKMIEIIKGGNF